MSPIVSKEMVKLLHNAKNTGAWKGIKRFFVDPFVVELATNGTNII